MSESGVVNIHGKEYKTVALRVSDFRALHPDYSITCEIISQSDLVTVKATIADERGRVISTGFSEENRGIGNINKTSALENAETSAVGRALAFFGLGGTEIASANEVSSAIIQQEVSNHLGYFKAHCDAAREHLDSIVAAKQCIADQDFYSLAEIIDEIPQPDFQALWRAPTNGSIWTTKEREVLKSAELSTEVKARRLSA